MRHALTSSGLKRLVVMSMSPANPDGPSHLNSGTGGDGGGGTDGGRGQEAVKKSTRGLHRTIAEWTKVRTLQG